MQGHALVLALRPKEVFVLRHMFPYLLVSVARMMVAWKLADVFPTIKATAFFQNTYAFYGITAIVFTVSWRTFTDAQFTRSAIVASMLDMSLAVGEMLNVRKISVTMESVINAAQIKMGTSDFSVEEGKADPSSVAVAKFGKTTWQRVEVVSDFEEKDGNTGPNSDSNSKNYGWVFWIVNKACLPCFYIMWSGAWVFRRVAKWFKDATIDDHVNAMVTDMAPYSLYIIHILKLLRDSDMGGPVGLMKLHHFNSALKTTIISKINNASDKDVSKITVIYHRIVVNEDSIRSKVLSPAILVIESFVGVLMIGYFMYLPVFASVSFGGEGLILVAALSFVILTPFVTSRVLRNPLNDMFAAMTDAPKTVFGTLSIECRIILTVWDVVVFIWNALVSAACSCPNSKTISGWIKAWRNRATH